MIAFHFARSIAKLVDCAAFARSSAVSLSITSPAEGGADQPFCGAEISTSTPASRMSTHTQPEAMQSSTNRPPTSCTASATARR